jgi:beta-lactamase superfamily II metal-dependent hydrolase
LIWIVQRLAEIPGACRAVCAPSAWVTGLWYAGLVLFFTGPVRWLKGSLALVLLSVVLWSTANFKPCREVKVLREGSSAVALCLPGNRWVLATDGDPFGTARMIRLLQKEGVNRLHALVVSGSRADAGTVRRLQSLFHPRETRTGEGKEPFSRAAGEGIVRIVPGR